VGMMRWWGRRARGYGGFWGGAVSRIFGLKKMQVLRLRDCVASLRMTLLWWDEI
jgi:hypothetical protein